MLSGTISRLSAGKPVLRKYDSTLFLLVKMYVKNLTHPTFIGPNLHKLVNQKSLGVLTDNLINKLTLKTQQQADVKDR